MPAQRVIPPHPTDPNSQHHDLYELVGHQHAVGTNSVNIGQTTSPSYTDAVVVGVGAVTNTDGVAIGRNAITTTNGVAIGRSASAGADGVAIGRLATAPARGFALGKSANSPPLAAADTGILKANIVEVVRSNSTGETAVVLSSANGTRYKLTVSNAGALVISLA